MRQKIQLPPEFKQQMTYFYRLTAELHLYICEAKHVELNRINFELTLLENKLSKIIKKYADIQKTDTKCPCIQAKLKFTDKKSAQNQGGSMP